MYVSVGLGVLTKGPVAAVLPVLVFSLYLLAHRELGRVKDMMIPLGSVIVLAIVLPWYVLLYQRSGWTYITTFLLGENVGRFTQGVELGATRPGWFYVPVLFSDSFPWSLFLPVAAWQWISERRRRVGGPDTARRIRTLLWLWILVIVAFFSFSATKQDLYIYPVIPAVAALGGICLARVRSVESASVRGMRATIAVIAGVVVLAGAALLVQFHTAGTVYELSGSAALGSAAIIGGLAALGLSRSASVSAGAVALAGSLIVLNWIFVLRVIPSFERYKPSPPLAAFLAERAGPADVIAHYQVALPSMVYYLRRHIDVTYDRATFLEMLRTKRPLYAVLSATAYEGLRTEAGIETCLLARQPTFDVKLKNMIAREPLPELVVITNHCGVPEPDRKQ
jgi:4-amino-4-deoxy-L-arabinose transferase-like glycosyltransferase